MAKASIHPKKDREMTRHLLRHSLHQVQPDGIALWPILATCRTCLTTPLHPLMLKAPKTLRRPAPMSESSPASIPTQRRREMLCPGHPVSHIRFGVFGSTTYLSTIIRL